MMELPYDEGSLEYLVSRLYSLPGVEPKSCYARDLIQTAVDTARYRGFEPRLTPDVVDWAMQLYLGERANGAP
jgi:hypothetical protein